MGVFEVLADPTVVSSGAACVALQLLARFVCLRLPPKTAPWRSAPGFTAHQLVCLPLMVYLAAVGVRAWAFPTDDEKALTATATQRLLVFPHPVGTHLAKIVLGELLFWDIPTGLLVEQLRDPLMLVHHVGMAFTALAGLGALSAQGAGVANYYAVFFFGFIELSGVPLTFVDVFHPKIGAWHAYEKTSPLLQAINGAARAVFALAYLSVRALYFPYVMTTMVVPDVFHVAALRDAERSHVPLATIYTVAVLGSAFSLLQIYWGVLVLNQLAKALGVRGAAPARKKA